MNGARPILDLPAALGPIPKTMRAGVYRGKGIVCVEEVPVPEVGDEEVLIKVACCGVCGTDIKKIFHAYVEPPQILGHEVAGTVAAVGKDVTKWKPGDRVQSFHHVPCGACFYCERRLFSQCPRYKTTGLTGGFTPNGLPFGVSLLAPSNQDTRLAALASEFHLRTNASVGATPHTLAPPASRRASLSGEPGA